MFGQTFEILLNPNVFEKNTGEIFICYGTEKTKLVKLLQRKGAFFMAGNLNKGIIFGKINVPFAKMDLQRLIGDPSNGQIQIYDENGHATPMASCKATMLGYFVLNFCWEPSDIGKMVNTDFRARLSVVKSDDTGLTILKDGIEIPLIIAVHLGNIQFSPLDDFVGPNAQAILDLLLKLQGIVLPAILSNQVRPTPEMYVILGGSEITI